MKIHPQTPLLQLQLLLLITITSNLISPSLSDKKTQDLINQICRTTSDFAFCINIIGGNTIRADLAGLTKLTIGLSLSFAKDTMTFIQRSRVIEKDADVQKLYDLCGSNYNKVVGFMDGADDAVMREDYESMLDLLHSCSKPIIVCQDAIASVDPFMRETNREMRVLLTMGLYAGSIL